MEKRWIWPPQLSSDVLHRLASFSGIEQQILAGRGLDTAVSASAFLAGHLPDINDPFALDGMHTAVDRIRQAAERGEKVVVYGDYDADGITATVLMVETLSHLGMQAIVYVPDRITEGYGINRKAISNLQSAGANLIISVDCGIRAVEAIEHANEIGVDVIVTDHHKPGIRIPDAYAVINPNKMDDSYPFKGLAGVGLAFKVAQALGITADNSIEASLLELVAIGTIADLAPLLAENRSLVARGLDALRASKRIGIRALFDATRQVQSQINARSIGFVVAPRLNAAGRLSDARKAIDLLLEQDPATANAQAQELEQINRRRRKLTTELVEKARAIYLAEERTEGIIFASHTSFHEGIVGLAASRLLDDFFRPTIIANTSKGITKGSARSIPGFNITQALENSSDLLIRFGGHAAAAGFSVKDENVAQLRNELDQYAAEHIKQEDLIPSIEIDAQVQFTDLDDDLLQFIDRLEPCGMGNPIPLFGARNVKVVNARRVGKDNNHLKLMLQQNEIFIDAIAFGQGETMDKIKHQIEIAFHFERNTYMGVENLQLNIRGIKIL